MEDYNAGIVTGDVVSISKEFINGFNVSVRVENVSLRDHKTYEEILPVRIDDSAAMLKVEEGKKVTLTGSLNTFDVTNSNGEKTKSTVLHANPATVKQVKANAPYENFAMIVGELRDKTCRPAVSGKLPWGYCLMMVSGKIFRAAFFRNVLVMMERNANRGSTVQHAGPMRYRPFETRDKRKGQMLEIVSQEDHFMIHETADIINPLEGVSMYAPDATPPKAPKK